MFQFYVELLSFLLEPAHFLLIFSLDEHPLFDESLFLVLEVLLIFLQFLFEADVLLFGLLEFSHINSSFCYCIFVSFDCADQSFHSTSW